MDDQKITSSAKSTEAFARDFAKRLKPGDTVALYGSLGAGKTTFIKGLAAGLGYKKEVYSPTFIFIRTYNINGNKIKSLHHIDLYRAEDARDLSTVGVDEFLGDEEAVTVIEWADKIENQLPKKTIRIKIEHLAEDKRKIEAPRAESPRILP